MTEQRGDYDTGEVIEDVDMQTFEETGLVAAQPTHQPLVHQRVVNHPPRVGRDIPMEMYGQIESWADLFAQMNNKIAQAGKVWVMLSMASAYRMGFSPWDGPSMFYLMNPKGDDPYLHIKFLPLLAIVRRAGYVEYTRTDHFGPQGTQFEGIPLGCTVTMWRTDKDHLLGQSVEYPFTRENPYTFTYDNTLAVRAGKKPNDAGGHAWYTYAQDMYWKDAFKRCLATVAPELFFGLPVGDEPDNPEQP